MRVIYCEKCKKYVGEIRDARLLKGIVFLCKDCNSKRTLDTNDLFKMFR